MRGGGSRPQVIRSIGIALGVVAMLAYPIIWNVLVHWKWSLERLNPGIAVDPVNPIWLLIVGVLLIAFGFREMTKRETPLP